MTRLSCSPPCLALLALLPLACGGGQEATSPAPGAGPGQPAASGARATAEAPIPEAKGNPSTELPPRRVFFGNPDRANVQISPDGKHLSWLAEVDGVLNVWVAPRSDLSKAQPVTRDKTRPVRSYFWAFTSDHILYLQDKGGDEDFHVYAASLKDGKTRDLTPGSKIRAQVAKISHKRPRKIVVGVNDRNPQLHDLYEVDIVTGDKKLLEKNPGFISYTLDDDFDVVLATSMRPDGGTSVYRKSPAKRRKNAKNAKNDAKPGSAPEGWTEVLSIDQADSMTTSVLGLDRSGRNIYLWDSRDRNTSALARMPLRGGKRRILAESDNADGSGVHFHPKTKKPLAVAFTHARQEWKVLDPRMKRDYQALTKLSDGEPSVQSSTLDLGTWVVSYLDDDGPVRYYLYERKNKQGTFLFTNRKELENMELTAMHPTMVKTRDGLELVNYLSLPAKSDSDGDGRPDSAQPMVLLVHGGPWARDHWGFNSLHQWLASRGYAVMSVNYRGSTGFGKEFLNAGNKEWAGKMHDDLLDSVKYAVDQGIAQQDRICIMGGSYGGYATLVGLTKTPKVFACGVDIVGPSSILTLLASIPPYWKPMQDLFKVRVGDWTTEAGRELLKQRSPLTHVDKIERPLLIGQGANDPRVKQAESDQIVQAMKDKNIPVSYVLFPDEGHGFARKPNRLAFFAAAEAFLSAHLGGRYQPVSADELEGSTIQVPEGAHGIPGFRDALPR